MLLDEYVKSHQELYVLFSKAYEDVFILKEIEHHNETIISEKKALLKASSDVLGYFAELVKADLAMTLYKLGLDRDKCGKQNTLYRLRKIALDAFPEENIVNISTPKDLVDIEKSIVQMRNSFLAHDQANRSSTVISISDMTVLLDRYLEQFNLLTYSDRSDKVQVLSKSRIDEIHMHVSMGLGLLIQRAYFEY